jgi:hypothetical protein
MNHEEAAVKAFIRSNRQERYLKFLSDPKQRHRFTTSGEVGHALISVGSSTAK